ncbi:MAG TPA: glycosyltransferase family 2 protein [Acidimicrobiales bacterium]|nr:glycosyltransferase family 2 protein [Acidimicrobiales bacterium]
MSVVLPAYNERPNLAELVPETVNVLQEAGVTYEVIVVDDGSTDGTDELMHGLRGAEVVYLRMRRNAGKSAALSAGLARAKGEYVVLMDADGQDDPHEIPVLLAAIDGDDGDAERSSGHAGKVDLVTGRRAVRNDRFVKRTTSKLYNRATSVVTGVPGSDFNSGLKVMRRELATGLELYGELHRYIPVLAQWRGFKVAEVDVEHHTRRHGESKFGKARFWRGFLDLITVKFLTTYTGRPFHLFGGLGVVMGAIGSGLLSWMLVLRVMGQQVGDRPALLTGILLVVVAVQMISLGLLAELSVHLRRRRNLDATVEVDDL